MICLEAPSGLCEINDALANNLEVQLGTGTFIVDGTINLTQIGHKLCGRGAGQTTIKSIAPALPIVSLTAGPRNYRIEGLSLVRDTAAILGGDGIYSADGYTGQARIQDVWVDRSYNGIVLGSCDTGYIIDCKVQNCVRDGISIIPATWYPTAQWRLDKILLAQNGRDGIRVQPPVVPGQQTCLGTWTCIETYFNRGYGINLAGNATTPIQDLRLSDSFIGADVLGGVRMDTYGKFHKISDCFFELSGGSGVSATSHNTDLIFSANRVNNNAGYGLFWGGGALVATGNNISGNSTGISCASDNALIVGNDLRGNTSSGYWVPPGGASVIANNRV